jgi:hypothetical protein
MYSDSEGGSFGQVTVQCIGEGIPGGGGAGFGAHRQEVKVGAG